MPFFSTSTIEYVFEDPTRLAAVYSGGGRSQFLDYLQARNPEFAGLPEDYIKLMFTSLLIYTAKPYGPAVNGSPLDVLLASDTLDCSTYCDAARWLYELLTRGEADIATVGWAAGVFGGHAQLMIASEGAPALLIDPTAMLFGLTGGLNDLTAGVPVPKHDQMLLGWRSETADFLKTASKALEQGDLRGGNVQAWWDLTDRIGEYGWSGKLPTALREVYDHPGESNNLKSLTDRAPINVQLLSDEDDAFSGTGAGQRILGGAGDDVLFGGALRDVGRSLAGERALSATAAFFSDAELASIRTDADEVVALYAARSSQFKELLGPAFDGLSEHHYQVAFASTLVHDLVSMSDDRIYDFNTALAASSLDAASQATLAFRLFRILSPADPSWTGPNVAMVGWFGPELGEHTQLIASTYGQKSLVADTAAGHIALVDSFNAMLGGDLVPENEQMSTAWRDETRAMSEATFTGFEDGLFRGSNYLYWFDTPDELELFETYENWASPQGHAYKDGSPGSAALGTLRSFDFIDGGPGADLLVGDGATNHAGQWLSTDPTIGNWLFGDFNGDGTADALRTPVRGAQAEVFLSHGSTFGEGSIWTGFGAGYQGWLVGDYNGDGRDDLLRMPVKGAQAQVFLSDGTSFADAGMWTGFGSGGQPWITGDFNGDGLSDLLRWHTSVGTQVLLSDGSKFGSAMTWSAIIPSSAPWLIGDFDGDDLDDLLLQPTLSSPTQVLLSTGNGFTDPTTWSNEVPGFSRWLVADVSGDGRDDLIGASEFDGIGQVLVSSGSFFEQSGAFLPAASKEMLYSADVDGDGADDLISSPLAGKQGSLAVDLSNHLAQEDVNVFVLSKGEIDGDRILDFDPTRDMLQLKGFGSGEDVSFTAVGDIWVITQGTSTETLQILNVTSLSPEAYYFV